MAVLKRGTTISLEDDTPRAERPQPAPASPAPGPSAGGQQSREGRGAPSPRQPREECDVERQLAQLAQQTGTHLGPIRDERDWTPILFAVRVPTWIKEEFDRLCDKRGLIKKDGLLDALRAWGMDVPSSKELDRRRRY
ncbi:hypothetical protein SAMN06265365_110120 [Tistlia consotensis]|uniref:Uncharacterized protein n=1 Tax=Tistlia consotensis USBA 355 TaxID=560819 RepID=A0A1Y6BSE1_9PROT|nr:hypothetical protein [Tistlia consotensis]SMF26897.1 hypothetical protein SAMN05428998_10936 [Tistlia consotensis USBA 355]SNR66747.1 hypothetical protein SAMN06265365_110120 [Tistlia consotensis]